MTDGTLTDGQESSTNPPQIDIASVSHYKISAIEGLNIAVIKFTCDTDITEWTVNVLGVSYDTGTIADSGGSVEAGKEIIAGVYYNKLYQEGENRINIYAKNEYGWTPYERNNFIVIDCGDFLSENNDKQINGGNFFDTYDYVIDGGAFSGR